MDVSTAGEITPREFFRIPLLASDDVRLILWVDGESLEPVLNDLGANGARFSRPDGFERFRPGRRLGRALLILPEFGMAEVFPTVRWTDFPMVGIEFGAMPERERARIYRYLFSVERRKVGVDRPSTTMDRMSGLRRSSESSRIH